MAHVAGIGGLGSMVLRLIGEVMAIFAVGLLIVNE